MRSNAKSRTGTASAAVSQSAVRSVGRSTTSVVRTDHRGVRTDHVKRLQFGLARFGQLQWVSHGHYAITLAVRRAADSATASARCQREPFPCLPAVGVWVVLDVWPPVEHH